MKSRFLFAILFAVSTTFSFGQLKVVSSGNVGIGSSAPASKLAIGTNGYTGYTISAIGFTGGNYYRAMQASQPVGTASTYTTYGITSSVASGSGGYKLFGVLGSTYRGTAATGARTYGVYGSAGNGYDGYNFGVFGTISGSRNGAAVFGSLNQYEPIASSPINGQYAGYFCGDVHVTGDITCDGTITGSDINLKKDILPIDDDVLAKLAKLQPIKYKLKHYSEYSELSDTTDMALISKEMESVKYQRERYGLIAQELQTTFPEVVKERNSGYLGVRYTELIPILVKAINQQQKQIESLVSQIEGQESNMDFKSVVTSTDGPNSDEIEFATLQQNVPNPFTENTIIKYSIPTIESYAMINVYDLSGRQVKNYNLTQPGNGEIMIPASLLDPGIFIYNLIVDGVEVESRRMVLTE